jgi:plasmid stabilization system protein ParE
MLRVVITPTAANDLVDIWAYIALHSIDAADRFLDRVRAQVELTASQPRRGERDQRVGGRRRFQVGPYLVYYQATDDTVYVLRVYHSARRIEDISFPDQIG